MKEVKYLQQNVFFTTREFAFQCHSSLSAASRKLARLERQEVVVKVGRGLWCQPSHRDFTPNAAASLLLGNERGYISFLSALHAHGVISQIPAAIQIATTGHGRTLETPIGKYEFFQLKPEMVRAGIAMSETNPPYLLACAEKALLDSIYISTRRGRRFASLPELDHSVINQKSLSKLLAEHEFSSRIASAVAGRLVLQGFSLTHRGAARRPGLRSGRRVGA